ncbi:MAG TPA: hypothetical protein VGK67_24370 [Myxococcales bacterium]|jgi:hypothetical protein
MKRLALSLACALAFVSYAACGDNGGNTNPPGGCNPACSEGKTCKDGKCITAQGLDAGDENADADIIIPVNHDAGGTVTPKPDAGEQACAAKSTKAQQLPLDMYLMLDKSGSMRIDRVAGGRTRWDAVTGALDTFFQASASGTSVALQYFPLQTGSFCDSGIPNACALDSDCAPCGTCASDYGGSTCSGGGLEVSCTTSDYATPAVEFAAMPGAAGQLSASIAAQKVVGSTPTSAGLQGAINHCKAWAAAHPDHVTIALLASDGDPTECNSDLSYINGIAASGASGSPKVLTFVIGVGAFLSNLNGIAAAGGTTKAYLVDTGGDVNAQLVAALNAIRGAALGCSYTIPLPASGTPDYTKVNVQYTPGGTTTAQILPQAASKAACPAGRDAWYYDNPSSPKQILLCDSTCNKVKTDTTGSVDVLLGCQTIIN